MRNHRDFVMADSVLKRYIGSGGDVVIPDEVTRIGAHAFKNCCHIASIHIPDSVTHIGAQAFKGCKGLADKNGFVIVKGILYGYWGTDTNIVIPNGVKKIDIGVFLERSDLISVAIPEGVTHLGNSAFYSCQSLESITLPDSLTTIGNEAFCNCAKLKDIHIPGSVTYISDLAFHHNDATRIQQLTIHAVRNSYAEMYAKENNIPFAAI